MKKLVIILTAAMLLYGLGSFALIDPSEGYYAEGAREMVESGDWLIPHLDYYPWFEKPILIYWLISISYCALGVSELASRLPSALSAIFMVIVFFLLVSKFMRRRPAFLSTLVLVSSPLFFVVKSLALTDMVFSTLCCTSALSLFVGFAEKRRRYLYGGYVALGLAVLCKGPLAIVLLGMWFILYFSISKRSPALIIDSIKKLEPLKGLAITLVIAAPWFIAAHFASHGAYTQEFFIDQNFGRLLTREQTHPSPWWFYIPIFFGGMFPWSILLLVTPDLLRRIIEKSHNSAHGQLLLFAIGSAFSGFCLFSLAGSKLPTYILPIIPFVSITVGTIVDYCIRLNLRKQLSGYFISIMVLKLLGVLGVAKLLQPVNDFASTGIILAIACIITAVTVVCINARGRSRSAVYAHTAFTTICVFFLVNLGFTVNNRMNHEALKQIVSEAKKNGIVIATYLRDSPAAVFYYKKKVMDLETPFALQAFVGNHEKDHCWLLSTVEMKSLPSICPKGHLLKKAGKWYVYDLN